MSLPWDDPASDPLADIRAMMVEQLHRGPSSFVFFAPWELQQRFLEQKGRPMTVADVQSVVICDDAVFMDKP